MSILILKIIYTMLLFFTGYYNEVTVVSETYLDWYVSENGVQVEPNNCTKLVFTGLNIICLFIKFYYIHL